MMSARRQLRGRVVAVSGAGAGNASAVAGALATRGAFVAIGDLDYAHAQEVASGINHTVTPAGGGIAIALGLDVCDPESFRRFSEETGHDFGPVDVLVNDTVEAANAGSRFVVPGMAQRSSGQVINVACQDTGADLSDATERARSQFADTGVAFTTLLVRSEPPTDPALVAEAVVEAVRARPQTRRVAARVGPLGRQIQRVRYLL